MLLYGPERNSLLIEPSFINLINILIINLKGLGGDIY